MGMVGIRFPFPYLNGDFPMLTRILSAVFAFALCGSAIAYAAQAADNPPPANTELIVVSKAIALANACAAVTGFHDETVGQGASQRVISAPYSISADTRWALTDNIGALNAVIETTQKVQRQLVADAEAKNGGPLKLKKEAVVDANGNITVPAVPSPEQEALNKELQKVMDSERPVAKLFHIKRADLKLGENPIPGMTLDALKPIVEP
jgi:hypothetical protein